MNAYDYQFGIIKERAEYILSILELPNIDERIMLMESSVHDIQDCLYWIKKEKDIDE